MIPKKKDQHTGTLYIRLIPENIKNYFKAYCAMRGKSMSEVIVAYMRQTLRDELEKSDKEKEGRSPKFTGTEGGGKTRISHIGHKSMDDRTLELVRDNPHRYSEEEISQIICEEWPDKNRDTIRNTTHRRLHGHLDRTKGVRIERDANGKYFIVE